MKAYSIYDHTLVGFQKKIGVKGNCFAVETDEGRRPVANIGLESLQAVGIDFPIEGEMRDKLFWMTDERIPKEAFRKKLCSCMGGPMPEGGEKIQGANGITFYRYTLGGRPDWGG